MKYEYNGNLLENDRIILVAGEIINKYNNIDVNVAVKAAMLEGKIDTDKTPEMEFNRLYNIMLVSKDNKEALNTVYEDLLKFLLTNKDNEKIDYYYDIVLEINNFLFGKRDFPYLEEFN